MSNQYQNDEPRMSRSQKLQEGKKRRSRKGVIFKVSLLFLTIMLFTVGAYAVRLLSQTQNALGNSYQQVAGKSVSKKISQNKPFSILLIGADTGGMGRTDQGNSDTLILATVNPKKKETKLISIPRDTLTEIKIPTKFASEGSASLNGYTIQKVNSAYSMGGLSLAIKTVERQLNVPVDYYMMVNFSSLTKIVNGIGGITVDVPFTFTSRATGGQYFKKGKMFLTGDKALAYARMRHEDPEGDYGRQKRQRQVIEAIIQKLLSANTLTKYQKVLNSISGSMKTDLTFDDMTTLASSYRGAANNMKSDYVHGNSVTLPYSNYPSGLSVEIPSTEELQRVSDMARKQLGLETRTLDTEMTRQNELNEENGFVFGGYGQYHIYSKNYDTAITVPFL
ncbi:LCP family protein [Lactobacillus sp. YT155]|uniref:LCP family protein n=1 Tax=Lactobacillus sp. YT155 TaxID=3060955 RepID=UPI00265EA3B0|nr:LCP family protein [Lactobacillus sp. YT155]MDO1604974.1 LCP family protein [Lactobacillus sp. YT155]